MPTHDGGMATGAHWQRLDSIVAALYREQARVLREQAREDIGRAEILTAAADRLDRAVKTGVRERWPSH